MGKSYILVEGHGEQGAVDNLIFRLSTDLGIPRAWAPAIRWPNLHLQRGIEKGAAFIRSKPDAEFPPNRSYKPTLDQLPLTRMVDFAALRKAGLACFGSLERALAVLADSSAGSVYPKDR